MSHRRHDDLHDPDQRPDWVDALIIAILVLVVMLAYCAFQGGFDAAS